MLYNIADIIKSVGLVFFFLLTTLFISSQINLSLKGLLKWLSDNNKKKTDKYWCDDVVVLFYIYNIGVLNIGVVFLKIYNSPRKKYRRLTET